ncbi:hypothetical protein BAY59_24500 [Prauserella coralliicola]|nr:hypothetical protein BAY59_24500 [Prauserella coralliicola]
MNSHTLILLITLVYLGLMLGIGLWANTRMKSSKEFLVAGQSLGFFVMAIASFSSIQSGWGMVGVTGTTASWGLGALMFAIAGPLAFALTWFMLGGKLRAIARRHQAFSIPDLIRVRYQNRSVTLWMSIALVVGTVGYMTAQVVAAGFITALLLGIDFATALVIGAVIVGLYTVAGGMLAAVWTDLVQGLLMIAMSVGVFFLTLGIGGGWTATLETLNSAAPEVLQLDGVRSGAWIVANTMMIILGMIGQPQLIHKFLMLRSTRELRWGALIASVGYGATTLFSLGLGLAARAEIVQGSMTEPSNPDDIVNSFLSQYMHPVVTALALTALLAAIMSSASSFITIGASAMTRDLLGSFGITLNRELRWNRIASVVIVGLSVFVALFLDQIIYLLGAIGWSAFAAAILGPIVVGLYWRRGTGTGALTAIITSLLLNVGLTIVTKEGWWTPPAGFFSGHAVIAVGMVVYVAVSYLTQNRADQTRFDAIAEPEARQQPVQITPDTEARA